MPVAVAQLTDLVDTPMPHSAVQGPQGPATHACRCCIDGDGDVDGDGDGDCVDVTVAPATTGGGATDAVLDGAAVLAVGEAVAAADDVAEVVTVTDGDEHIVLPADEY